MKAVFAHDHIFKKDIKDNYYTGACYNNTVWKRYLKHFKTIKVVARVDKYLVSENDNFNKFNMPGMSFQAVPSLSGPLSQFKNKGIAMSILKKAIKNSDVLIARLPSETGNLAIKIAKKLKKPYLVEVVGCVWDSLWNYGNLQAKVYAPLAYSRMKRNVKYAPNAVYVTNKFLQNRYPCNGNTENISN